MIAIIIFLTFGLLIGMCFVIAQMSKEKDVGFWTLFSISLLLSPIVGLIYGLTRKNKIKNNSFSVRNNIDNNQLLTEDKEYS